MSNGKDMIILLIIGFIKKIQQNEILLHKISQYFPKTYMNNLEETLMSKLIYLIMQKTDLKDISHVDASSFSLKLNKASLKVEIDKLDIGKLVHVLADLSKLSDVVKNDVVKKVDMINQLKK